MTRAFVGIGSNLGDRVAQLCAGVQGLRASEAGLLVAVSPIFETDPVGGPQQGDYLNAVLAVDWSGSAPELLARLLEIERAAGRARGERDGPRCLDLDLLLFGVEVIEQAGLVVPHPRMTQRGFVLRPLACIAPGLVHPILAETVEALAARVRDDTSVRPFGDSSLLLR